MGPYVRVDITKVRPNGEEVSESKVYRIEAAGRLIANLSLEIVSVDIYAATYEEYVAQYNGFGSHDAESNSQHS